MKTVCLCVLLALLFSGCAVSQETRLATEPRTYNEAMDWIRNDLQLLDKHLIGSQYDLAVADAERIFEFSRLLAQFEPPRMTNTYEAFEEYYSQAQDMAYATDRLLYFVQQRRKLSSKEQLWEVAGRYNRLSVEYGPNLEVRLTEQEERPFASPERYRGELPGELRYNR
jgi:hypothetical protein